jgi:hypothetical protein
MNKKSWITKIVILAVVILVIIILTRSSNGSTEELAKCIGENSELYIQLGCHACESQEDMFGENYQYLTTIDCFYNQEECIDKEIKGTPTWIINGQEYLGSKSIEELKNLTGC